MFFISNSLRKDVYKEKKKNLVREILIDIRAIFYYIQCQKFGNFFSVNAENILDCYEGAVLNKSKHQIFSRKAADKLH